MQQMKKPKTARMQREYHITGSLRLETQKNIQPVCCQFPMGRSRGAAIMIHAALTVIGCLPVRSSDNLGQWGLLLCVQYLCTSYCYLIGCVKFLHIMQFRQRKKSRRNPDNPIGQEERPTKGGKIVVGVGNLCLAQ